MNRAVILSEAKDLASTANSLCADTSGQNLTLRFG
jgi:hypothetical protein